jgi:hypothetical protein
MSTSTQALDAAKRVAAAARCDIPSKYLNVGGRALYSAATTLASGSRFYFLGVNPSDAPRLQQAHSVITVAEDLLRLERNEVVEHGFLDEAWKDHAPGAAPIQQRGQQLFSILAEGSYQSGEELLRATPTSNFVLRRSTNVIALEGATSEKAGDLAVRYWPFHRAVIQETQCKVVVTHAVTLARELANRFGLGQGQTRPSGWGGTLATCYAWRLREGPVMLAIPNLSRYVPLGGREPALRAFFQEFATG